MLTCTGVSFFHGSNDGQKGMGLIMLILIGTVPTAYALNHAVTSRTRRTSSRSRSRQRMLDHYVSLTRYWRSARRSHRLHPHQAIQPQHHAGAAQLVNDIGNETSIYKELKNVPKDRVRNFRNDMYLVSEALRLMAKIGQAEVHAADTAVLANYKKHIDHATKFIPTWVKVAVAMALGLGTMVGWKRIVVTVGEKIGKDHLTYAQGAAAEITAWRRSARPIGSDCRSVRRTCFPPASRAPWRPTSGMQMGHGPQPGDGLGAHACRSRCFYRAACSGCSRGSSRT